MPNRAIRAVQSANSKKLDEHGSLLVRQRTFPRPTLAVGARYQSQREIERRRLQIVSGQLTAGNGLVDASR